jgi:hypothetical protein
VPKSALHPGIEVIYRDLAADPAHEHHESYLRSVFSFLGLHDVTVVRAEGTAVGVPAWTCARSRHQGRSHQEGTIRHRRNRGLIAAAATFMPRSAQNRHRSIAKLSGSEGRAPELAGVKNMFVKAAARVNNPAENSHQPTRERGQRKRGSCPQADTGVPVDRRM